MRRSWLASPLVLGGTGIDREVAPFVPVPLVATLSKRGPPHPIRTRLVAARATTIPRCDDVRESWTSQERALHNKGRDRVSRCSVIAV